MNELVTVCITTFNRKTLLIDALKSVLEQDYHNLEILIVDDASIDGTKEALEESYLFKDSRVKYFKHLTNKGLASSRNTAIFNAKGEYFTFCDDDDRWQVNMVTNLLFAINRTNEINVSFGVPSKFKGNCLDVYKEKTSIKDLMIQGVVPPVSSQMYKVSLLKKIKGYDQEIKSGVDHDLWIRLSSAETKVGIGWDAIALVNDDLNSDKMTTNQEKRINNIEYSLIHWKKNIVREFGSEFYIYFCKEYREHLIVSFFMISFRQRQYLNLIKLFFTVAVLKKIVLKVNFLSEYEERKCGYFKKYYGKII
jgi:glycosyltransferase involved in cell wall biosynthesis